MNEKKKRMMNNVLKKEAINRKPTILVNTVKYFQDHPYVIMFFTKC